MFSAVWRCQSTRDAGVQPSRGAATERLIHKGAGGALEGVDVVAAVAVAEVHVPVGGETEEGGRKVPCE